MTADTVQEVRFESFGEGTELWGGVQANFAIIRPPHSAREVAVILNTPAAQHLASMNGREDTPEFRREATRLIGAAYLRKLLEAGAQPEAVAVLSRVSLERDPSLAAAVSGAN